MDELEAWVESIVSRTSKIMTNVANMVESKIEGDLLVAMRRHVGMYYATYKPTRHRRQFRFTDQLLEIKGSVSEHGGVGQVSVSATFLPKNIFTKRDGTTFSGTDFIIDSFLEGTHPRRNQHMSEDFHTNVNQEQLFNTFADAEIKKIQSFALDEIGRQIQALF